MILANVKAHRIDTNLAKESSSAIIDVETEPPCKKQRSIACKLGGATKISIPKKSLEAEKSKSSQRQLNVSTAEGWKSTTLECTMEMSG